VRNKTSYEWKAEFTDSESGDIGHVEHIEKLNARFVSQTSDKENEHVVFCLVKDIGNDDDGIKDRFHWYPHEHGQPGEDEFQPPRRYIEEARKFGLIK